GGGRGMPAAKRRVELPAHLGERVELPGGGSPLTEGGRIPSPNPTMPPAKGRPPSPLSAMAAGGEAAVVAAVARHIARLASSDDPVARAIADFLEEAPGLHEFILEIQNEQGRNFVNEAITAARDELLRELNRFLA